MTDGNRQPVEVRGLIRLASASPGVGNATLAYVRIRDVSLIDEPSAIVAEKEVRIGQQPPTSRFEIPFVLSFVPAAARSYALEAHVSIDGSPDLEPGDYITMESYPLAHEAPSSPVILTARRIEKGA